MVLCAVSSVAAQSTGGIVGIVRDATGAPLQNVTISVRGSADGSTLTGRDGRFQLLNLPEGDYELDAELSGFAPARRVVRVVTGQTADVAVTLAVHVLEQTVVTAAKTGERDVQKLPMAISVLPAADLHRTESHSIAQIAGLAPSVTFSQNSDFSQLTIRGIGSNVVFAGSDPSSAVYLDGVYLARPVAVLADFLELERIEVLRGPRGTLYGRNAVGGALNLVTKEPTNDFAASARFSVATLDALRTEASVSGPLVRGRVLASGAILRGVRDGFVRDLNNPDHPLGGEDATAGRGKLLVVFNRRMDVTLSGDFTRQDPAPLTYAKVLAVKPGFQVDNPADLHEVRASTLALATMAATLAFGGRNPATGKQVMDPDKVSGVLAVMATAGLYDDSGKWLHMTGLPAKSGVGGGIIAVSPGKFGIAVVSPPLDDAGNSVRAQRAIADISNALGGNPYSARKAGS
jgi:outer membrane receptor protein involved in Fe transport